MNPVVSVQKTSSGGIDKLLERLRGMKEISVMVGIPADKAIRKEDSMNNATLGFLLTNGSELNGIPPTPFLVPGILKVRQLIAQNLGEAAKATIQGKPERVRQYMNRAGIIGANSVKRYFTDPDNGWPPNKPSTIRQKGSDKRNIDTSQLRGAITYVLVEHGIEMPKVQKTKKVEDFGLDGKIKTVEESVPEIAEVGEVAAIL